MMADTEPTTEQVAFSQTEHVLPNGAELLDSEKKIPQEPEQVEEEPKFPGPLMRKDLKKENLIQFIQWKAQKCLQKLESSSHVEEYFFWKIMELFCHRNGKVMMYEVAMVFFRGSNILMKMALNLQRSWKDWCLPLAKLLCSSVPNDELREAVIKMGDDLASKKWTFAAHICYMVAKLELGSRRKFELIGSRRVPFGFDILSEAIMRTETYEYVLSLSSGLPQPSFQIFKLCYVTRMVYTKLAQCDLSDDAIKYCETMTRAAIAFPDRIKGSFIKRLLSLSYTLLEKEEVEPEWLLELRQLQRTSDNGVPEQHTAPTSQDVGSESHDALMTDEIPVLRSPDQDQKVDPADVFDSRYTLGDILGSGAFSTVYEGVRKKDGKQVAIKKTKKNGMGVLTIPGETQELPREMALMKMVTKSPRCNNVLALLDWYDLGKNYLLVLEYPSPCVDLWHFLENAEDDPPESLVRNIMLQVVQAAHYCCERRVLHRDIKPENLLINTETLQVKLIDFGCGDILKDTPYEDYEGTQYYIPPESIMFSEYMGIPATIWSLGILLNFLVSGEYPFEEIEDLASGDLNFIPDVSRECFELIMWCLDINPDMRPTFDDLVMHEWFTGALRDKDQI